MNLNFLSSRRSSTIDLKHLIYEWPEAFACFSLKDLRHVDDSVDFWVSNKLRSHVHVMHLSSYHKKMNGKLSTTDRARVSNGNPNWNKSKSLKHSNVKPTFLFKTVVGSPFFFLRFRSHEWLSLENLVSFAILSRCHSLLPFIMGASTLSCLCSSGLHCFLFGFFAPFIYWPP